jgi:hypothetical protein
MSRLPDPFTLLSPLSIPLALVVFDVGPQCTVEFAELIEQSDRAVDRGLIVLVNIATGKADDGRGS